MLTRAASALQRLAARPLPQVRSISLNRVRKYRNIEKQENKRFVCVDDPEDEIPIEQYANKIDTTLTPEQKEYVDKLKKKMNGANSPRCKCHDLDLFSVLMDEVHKSIAIDFASNPTFILFCFAIIIINLSIF